MINNLELLSCSYACWYNFISLWYLAGCDSFYILYYSQSIHYLCFLHSVFSTGRRLTTRRWNTLSRYVACLLNDQSDNTKTFYTVCSQSKSFPPTWCPQPGSRRPIVVAVRFPKARSRSPLWGVFGFRYSFSKGITKAWEAGHYLLLRGVEGPYGELIRLTANIVGVNDDRGGRWVSVRLVEITKDRKATLYIRLMAPRGL